MVLYWRLLEDEMVNCDVKLDIERFLQKFFDMSRNAALSMNSPFITLILEYLNDISHGFFGSTHVSRPKKSFLGKGQERDFRGLVDPTK